MIDKKVLTQAKERLSGAFKEYMSALKNWKEVMMEISGEEWDAYLVEQIARTDLRNRVGSILWWEFGCPGLYKYVTGVDATEEIGSMDIADALEAVGFPRFEARKKMKILNTLSEQEAETARGNERV